MDHYDPDDPVYERVFHFPISIKTYPFFDPIKPKSCKSRLIVPVENAAVGNETGWVKRFTLMVHTKVNIKLLD